MTRYRRHPFLDCPEPLRPRTAVEDAQALAVRVLDQRRRAADLDVQLHRGGPTGPLLDAIARARELRA